MQEDALLELVLEGGLCSVPSRCNALVHVELQHAGAVVVVDLESIVVVVVRSRRQPTLGRWRVLLTDEVELEEKAEGPDLDALGGDVKDLLGSIGSVAVEEITDAAKDVPLCCRCRVVLTSQ